MPSLGTKALARFEQRRVSSGTGWLESVFQGFLALSKSFASMKWSCSFCSCCYACCYSLTSTGSVGTLLPGIRQEATPKRRPARIPALKVDHTPYWMFLYITRIYEEMRPAVVLTKMTDMHHVCEVDYQGRCDGHQWDGPGMKGESLRTVPKLPAGYNVTLKWSIRVSTVSSFQNLLASFWILGPHLYLC